MKQTIEGIYTYSEFAACAVAWLPLLAGSAILHRNDDVPRVQGRLLRNFGRAASFLTPLWRFSIEGEPPADIRARPYVVIANHVSTADPFLLSWLKWDMQWVAKEELFRAPLIGWLLRLGGDIPLRRGEGESIRAMLSSCRHALRHRLSVMIFPEGTRSQDGGVHPFKEGAFRLAIEAGVPILPIAIGGTHRCMPKGARWLGRAHAIARVLEPIDTRGMGAADVSCLRDRARARIAANVADIESALARELAGTRPSGGPLALATTS
jgi:1-acyl-sn-glycerol-3-phosphate acyltransferase